MAQQFVSMEEAAARLGITKERLNELREAGKARAFRDGISWKFKEQEINRLAAQGVTEPAEEAPRDSAPDLVTESPAGDGSDSILLSELELGENDADKGSSSTIIGDDGEGVRSDSDLEVAARSPAVESSDLDLETDSDLILDGNDGSRLEGNESNVLSVSSGDSGVLGGGQPDAPGSQFEHLEELDLDLDLDSSQLSLSEDSTTGGLKAAAAPGPGAGRTGGEEPGPAEPVSPRPESSVKLADDEDDEVVLGEAAASDITLDSHESGISLTDASDAGISLDDVPLDLGGSSVESFDLNGDDTVTVSDPIEDASREDGEDFVLTSVEDAGGSGSQVVSFGLGSDVDENTATILGSEPSLGSDIAMDGVQQVPMLEEAVEEPRLAAAAAPAGASAVIAAAALRATQYSGWNIAFLVLCVLLLVLSGTMMFDLLRSMWSWNEPYALNSTIMDAILNALF